MLLDIYSLEKILYEGESNVVVLPTENGQISVLPGHAPLVTLLKSGEITTRTKTEEKKIPIGGGFAQISGNRIIILAD